MSDQLFIIDSLYFIDSSSFYFVVVLRITPMSLIVTFLSLFTVTSFVSSPFLFDLQYNNIARGFYSFPYTERKNLEGEWY